MKSFLKLCFSNLPWQTIFNYLLVNSSLFVFLYSLNDFFKNHIFILYIYCVLLTLIFTIIVQYSRYLLQKTRLQLDQTLDIVEFAQKENARMEEQLAPLHQQIAAFRKEQKELLQPALGKNILGGVYWDTQNNPYCPACVKLISIERDTTAAQPPFYRFKCIACKDSIYANSDAGNLLEPSQLIEILREEKKEISVTKNTPQKERENN